MIREQFRQTYCNWLMNLVNSLANTIQPTTSGALLETILSLMPDSAFYACFDFIENDTADQQQKCLLLSEMTLSIASRMHITPTRDQLMCGINTIYIMMYCESLRRKGLMSFTISPDIFVASDWTSELTANGKAVGAEMMARDGMEMTTNLVM